MKLLRIVPLAALLAVAACSGTPTAPASPADAPPVLEMGTVGGGGLGSGSLDGPSFSGDDAAQGDSTAALDPNMFGSGN